ncbi:MAG: hypothetical protein LBD84_02265 [Campylobacteraceae bacterium]|jgi:hypothetical protein|nr:hypothetical protein [Campylobacteraceae bacterium]
MEILIKIAVLAVAILTIGAFIYFITCGITTAIVGEEKADNFAKTMLW